MLEAEGESQTVRTKCSMCRAVNEYLPEALRLVTLETTTYMLQRSFEFFCVRCHNLDIQLLPEESWLRLLDAGVPVRVICFVDEAGEIWVRRDDAPLVAEDVQGWIEDIEFLTGLPDELTVEAELPSSVETSDDNERSQ